MTSKADIWKGWTDQYIDTDNPLPLFATDNELRVEYNHYGKDDRPILKRSEKMEDLVREEGRKVIND